jgi:hypothetical protein
METTVSSTSYLDMLQHVTVPQLQQDTDNDINNTCQQDGAPLQSEISQWQISQIGWPVCTRYQLASLFTQHYTPSFLPVGLHQGLGFILRLRWSTEKLWHIIQNAVISHNMIWQVWEKTMHRWYKYHVVVQVSCCDTSIMLPKQPTVFWIICVLVNSISLQFSIWSITAAHKMTWYDNSSTCSLEISTQLQPLPDTAFRMRRKCFLNIVHLNPAWQISALPEQTIYEHLNWTQSITRVSCARHRSVATNKEQYLHNQGLLPGKSKSHSQNIQTSSDAHPAS